MPAAHLPIAPAQQRLTEEGNGRIGHQILAAAFEPMPWQSQSFSHSPAASPDGIPIDAELPLTVKNTFIDVADEESPDSMTSFHDGAKTCTARMSETASPARFFISHDSRADDMNYCICRNRGFFFFRLNHFPR
ncbi:Uncharacterized protein SCF082_LOCUS24988 [Durusdinium trenchii]|uniref:Uncharacterized protein n=1 Tax=Durusdinium trenchii TaxID=1381693 RepID=A0ABP0LX66_9DINO